MSEPSVYTTGDVARLVQVATRTVAAWCDEGLLASYVIGSHRRIIREELVKFLKSNSMPPIEWFEAMAHQEAKDEDAG